MTYKVNYLEHHGIKGMKWYERRFQNEDGSLTPAGRIRYGVGKPRESSVAVQMKNGLKKAGSTVVNAAKAKAKAYAEAAPERKAAKEAKREEKRKAEEIEKKRKSGEYDEDDAEYAKINSQEKLEAYKQKLIRSSDADKLAKRQDLFTTQELQDALTRIQKSNQLSELARQQLEAKRKNTGLNKFVDKWSARIDTGLKIIGTIDKVKSGMEKISSWNEDDEFMNLTPSELAERAQSSKMSDLKKITERMKAYSDLMNTKQNIDKIAKNSLNKSNRKFDVSKMTPDEIREHLFELDSDQLNEAKIKTGTQKDIELNIRAIKGKGKNKTDEQDGGSNSEKEKPGGTKKQEESSKQKNAESQSDDKQKESANSPESKVTKWVEAFNTNSPESKVTKWVEAFNTGSNSTYIPNNNKSQLIQPSTPPENANNNRSNLFGNTNKSEKDQAWENLGKAMEKTYNDNKISNNEKAMERAKEQAERAYQMGMAEAEKAANEASEQIERFLEAEKYYANRLGYKG